MSSQSIISELPYSSIPSFFINNYTIHSVINSWVKSNTLHFIDALITHKTTLAIGVGHNLHMVTWAHDPRPSPDFPYTKAVSAHSAAIQLYAGSGQLMTAEVLYKRGKKSNDLCSFRCQVMEDMHHIFISCKQYGQWRNEANRDLVDRTELKLSNMQIEGASKNSLFATAKLLFTDSAVIWPLHHLLFYLGKIPYLNLLISKEAGISEIVQRRLKSHLSSDWHTSSI